ncbi:MAG: MFS transporter, partial [Pseudomonadota bacterium]
MAVALPGILVVLLMLTIKEPPRRDRAQIAPAPADAPSFGEMFAYLRSHARVYGAIIVGFTFLASAQFGISAWTPSFFIRTYGWTPAEVGAAFGPLVMVLGVAGVVSGGWINDFLLKRGVPDANLRMPMFAAILSAPFVVAFPLAGDPWMSLACLAPVLFFGTMPFGAGPATLPMITPNRMRAQVVAIYLLVANMVGYALGPTLIALVTDYALGDPQKLFYSLAFAPAAILAAGVVVLALGLAPFRRMLKEQQD